MYGLKRTALHSKVFLILHTRVACFYRMANRDGHLALSYAHKQQHLFQKNSAKIQKQCAKN